jgi:hypothetical protein
VGRSLQSLRRRGRHGLQEGRQEPPGFGDRLHNPRESAKKWIAVELHNFENLSEKVNKFNVASGGFPIIETAVNPNE